jgi:hypothetical protein
LKSTLLMVFLLWIGLQIIGVGGKFLSNSRMVVTWAWKDTDTAMTMTIWTSNTAWRDLLSDQLTLSTWFLCLLCFRT